MTDLISRSAVLAIGNVRRVTEYDEAGYDMSYDAVPVEAIEALQAIDVVPVVRCKDCKHWRPCAGATEHVKCCEFAGYMVGANGYCVYGEKREEDTDETD